MAIGRGRPNQGKMKTLKKRAVYIYLPTEDMVARWKKEADRYGTSLSRFVTEVVDDAIRDNPSGLTPKEELERDLRASREEVKVLKERLDSAETTLKQAQGTIADYRQQLSRTVPTSVDTELTGMLIEHFIKRRVLPVDEVPDMVGISLNDPKDLARLHTSIGFLRAVGLVESTMFEWRWKGGAKRKIIPAAVRRRPARVHHRVP